MSYNQSRVDKNEPPQYRKTGRLGPRYSGGGKGGGGGGGGGNSHPPSNRRYFRVSSVFDICCRHDLSFNNHLEVF